AGKAGTNGSAGWTVRSRYCAQLNKFDQKLIDAWGDLHGPMCDDMAGASEQDKQRRGCQILDWSHEEASAMLMKVGSKAAPAFLVQGTFQQLADDRSVGWHPDYEALLPKRKDPDAND